jgi:energy-converting hydrogenase Eha subunit F
MTDIAPPHLAQPPRRPRALSRIHALLLALVLIVGGVAIARADRPDQANLLAPGGL